VGRPVDGEKKILSVGVFKIILILTRGIPVNYANLRGICEIFPKTYHNEHNCLSAELVVMGTEAPKGNCLG
jgi:hypothetical protein